MAKVSGRKAARNGVSLSKVGLEGFDELKAMLSELPRATQRNTLKKAAKVAMAPMVDAVRDSAPVRSGKLRDSVRLTIGVDDPGYRARARAAFRAKGHARGVKKTKGGGNVTASIRVGGRAAPHAPFIEFGTVHMAADPFLRPAFDAEAPGAVDGLRVAMRVEVRKAAARRAKKLAKARAI